MEISKLSWKEIKNLPQDTIFLLTVSPMEAHGPHLPISTDFIISKKLEEKTIEELKRRNIPCISLPSLPLGVCKYVDDFPGTISISWKNLYKLLLDIFISFAQHNFKYFLICNFHMDPWHIKAIHKAIKKGKKYGIVACEPISVAYFKGKLFEKMEGEVHADLKETSIALYLFPELVKNYKIEPVKIKIGLLKSVKKFREIGAEEAYIGSPSEANADFGKEIFEKMVETCVNASLALKENKVEELPIKLKILLRI